MSGQHAAAAVRGSNRTCRFVLEVGPLGSSLPAAGAGRSVKEVVTVD